MSLVVSSPYRTEGAFERLGATVSVHKPRAGEYTRALLMAAGFLVIGLFTGIQAVEAAGRQNWGVAMVALPIAIAGLVIAGLCASHLSRLHSHRLEIRQFGIRVRGDAESMMLWDEVGELAWAARGKRGRHHVLVTRDGRRVVIADEFGQAAEIARTVEKEVLMRLLPPLRARLEASEEVSFGPFSVSKEGVSHGKRRLLWHLVQRAVIVNGFFAIGARGADVVALPKADGVLAWAKVPFDQVSNAPLLLAVVAEYRGRVARPETRSGTGAAL